MDPPILIDGVGETDLGAPVIDPLAVTAAPLVQVRSGADAPDAGAAGPSA